MNEMFHQEPDEPLFAGQPSAKSFFTWLFSAIVGCVFALILSAIAIPAIYGVTYSDPASVWMLSGVADIYTGFTCIPAFLLVHLISFMLCRGRNKALLPSAIIALGIGLAAFLPSVIGVWHSQGAQKVLRAR